MSGNAPAPRWYQLEGETAVHASHATNKSTLVVAATGTGKSVLFSRVALKYTTSYKRVLCLAHRKELVQQNAATLQWVTGEPVDIEMAEEWAGNRSRVVSASVQTMSQPRRLERWDPGHFDLIIADEAHHFLSPTFKRILDHFTGKVLGVTATPDRGDEKALGRVFGDVAYVFDIVNGIEQGYLVPIRGRSVTIQDIDISHISKTQGDLAAGELDNEMVRHVESIINKTLELEPNRRGIWFWPGVQSAELAADRINAIRPGSCGFICGDTPKEERDRILQDFKSGKLQHLSNCAIFVEGTDIPTADMIVMGRPTLSRAFYAQCIGRGLRVLAGLVDYIHGKEGADARRALVAASAKSHCVVIDFCGNAGKHSLITPEDLLGGSYTDDEVKKAKELAKELPELETLELLDAARRELKAMMARIESRVKAKVTSFDPFSTLHLKEPPRQQELYREPITLGQQQRLSQRFRMTGEKMQGLSKLEAQKLIGTLEKRQNLGLASLAQLHTLQKYGIDQINISFTTASRMINYISSTGWNPSPVVLQSMLKGSRTPSNVRHDPQWRDD
jgi:superfamily II DNA or RNA helicase